MSTNGSTEAQEPALTPATPSSRIARFDQFFDPRTRSTVYRKTNKNSQAKLLQKLNQKKPVLVVKRVIDSKGRYSHTEIEIRSLGLRDALVEIHTGVQGLDLLRTPPFCDEKLLFHSYHDLVQRLERERLLKDNVDAKLISDIEVALQFVHEDHTQTFQTMETLLSGDAPSITFDLLWALFRPGTHVFNHHEYTDQDRILSAQSFDVRKDPLNGRIYALIVCHVIANDGQAFGLANVPLEIDLFDGARKVQDLPSYPLKYHKRWTTIKEAAIRRGRKFVRMETCTFHEIEGPAIREVLNPRGEIEFRRFQAYGRVMIDPGAFRIFEPFSEINIPISNSLDPESLTEDQYLICTPIVLGFCFGVKMWGGFALDRLVDVEWSDKPFDTLVLNPKLKGLIYSMVKQHSSNASTFDDVVKGKGKGLIGLLSGPPGCGKTLTAEAVAEATKCPLYCMSAGELGTELTAVDKALTQILELAQKWKAVVLLDEADVFLAQRNNTDIERNALVSIFLRKLEYYEGILILTTNLISQCDAAFESRIHFTVHYPNLSYPSRRQIWETFIEKTSAVGKIGPADLDVLAEEPLNGRQIKNTISVAQSFAAGGDVSLSVEHIRTVLEVMRDWQKAREDQSMESILTALPTVLPNQLVAAQPATPTLKKHAAVDLSSFVAGLVLACFTLYCIKCASVVTPFISSLRTV